MKGTHRVVDEVRVRPRQADGHQNRKAQPERQNDGDVKGPDSLRWSGGTGGKTHSRDEREREGAGRSRLVDSPVPFTHSTFALSWGLLADFCKVFVIVFTRDMTLFYLVS